MPSTLAAPARMLDCACHAGGAYPPPCSIPGGCGSAGCACTQPVRRGRQPGEVLCAISDCSIPGRHLDDCHAHDICPGCLPGLAADGLLLCQHHVRWIGIDAARCARLHGSLGGQMADPARRNSQISSYVCVSFGGSPMPDPHLMDLREEIRLALVGTAGMIMSRRGITGPLRTVTRRVPGAPPQVLREPTGNREALAVFIARHAEWLAAQPEAAQVSERFHRLGRIGGEAWRAAHPSGPTRVYLGTCPAILYSEDGSEPDEVCDARLYALPDEPLVTCPNCGTSDTIEQWRRWLYPDNPVEVDGYEGAAALSLRWFRSVTSATIRDWSRERDQKVRPIMVSSPDGKMVPDPGGAKDPDDPTRPLLVPLMVRKTDVRGRTLYMLDDLFQAARRMWGPEPDPRASRPANSRASGARRT